MINEKLSSALESGEIVLEGDLKSSPLETSLKGFGLYFPLFENLVNHKLSGTSAKRILIALFASKLEDRKVNLKRPEEVETFKISTKLFDDILVLHLAAMLEAEQRRQNDVTKRKLEEANEQSQQQVSSESTIPGQSAGQAVSSDSTNGSITPSESSGTPSA